MTHLVLLTALTLYAVVVFFALRRFGVGLAPTLVAAAITIGFVWGALYLAYVSDALYEAGLAKRPASFVWREVPFAWLWHYIAVNGWIVGVVVYVPIWLGAALFRAINPRPNNPSKPMPLRGAA